MAKGLPFCFGFTYEMGGKNRRIVPLAEVSVAGVISEMIALAKGLGLWN